MQDQRQYPRFRVRWRVAVRRDETQMSYGETIDVSVGGACFLMDQNLNSGAVVQLYFQLPQRRQGQEAPVVSTRAKVLYTAFSADHDRWRLGVQFVDINA